jgi:Ca2+-binding EF-hand superfamily protein
MDKKSNPCRLEKTSNVNMPGDMLNDLTEAFAFYDKDDSGFISIAHFRNILHNFGFHRLSKRECDDEMRR